MAQKASETLKKVKRIGRLSYDRNALIGSGSFGKVYKGTFKESEESPEIDVAIKRIEDIEVNEIEKVFMDTIDSHPNVLQCYCIEKDEDFLYIASELCNGTLEDIIKGSYNGPEVGSLREMMRQVARGLEHLHKNNIVHRDIKPANILVSFPDPETKRPPLMKLADFGLCHAIKSDGSESSLTKCGSKGWMAPELYNPNVRIKEEQAIFALDIYSLGCVFAYSLSKENQHPFGTGNLKLYRMENKEDIILTNEDFNHYGQTLFDLIQLMLHPLVSKRFTINQVMEHPFFIEGVNEENKDDNEIISSDFQALISGLQNVNINTSHYYNVNSRDSMGRTPLMLLCSKNHFNFRNENLRYYVEQFLSLPNVDKEIVNAKDVKGNTALTLLSEHYNSDDLPDILYLLLQKGAKVNDVTLKKGFSTLMLLCMQYNHDRLIDVIRLFVEEGAADLTIKSDDGWDVLLVVCRYYNHAKLLDVIALLIKYEIDLNASTSPEGFNAITFLCLFYTKDYMIDIVGLLIDNGFNPNMQASNGFNALCCVCFFYHRDNLINIIRMLIDKEPSVVNSASKRNGSNPLLMVCQEYSKSGPDNLIEIIRLLIDKGGMDVNYQSWEGWNALMLVCRFYRHKNLIDIIKLLVIEYGCEINRKTNFGSNAFLLLCGNENLHHDICLDVISLMIDLNADVDAVYEADSENTLTTLFKFHHTCHKMIEIVRQIVGHPNPPDVNHKNKKAEDAISILRAKSRLLKDIEGVIELLRKSSSLALHNY